MPSPSVYKRSLLRVAPEVRKVEFKQLFLQERIISSRRICSLFRLVMTLFFNMIPTNVLDGLGTPQTEESQFRSNYEEPRRGTHATRRSRFRSCSCVAAIARTRSLVGILRRGGQGASQVRRCQNSEIKPRRDSCRDRQGVGQRRGERIWICQPETSIIVEAEYAWLHELDMALSHGRFQRGCRGDRFVVTGVFSFPIAVMYRHDILL